MVTYGAQREKEQPIIPRPQQLHAIDLPAAHQPIIARGNEGLALGAIPVEAVVTVRQVCLHPPGHIDSALLEGVGAEDVQLADVDVLIRVDRHGVELRAGQVEGVGLQQGLRRREALQVGAGNSGDAAVGTDGPRQYLKDARPLVPDDAAPCIAVRGVPRVVVIQREMDAVGGVAKEGTAVGTVGVVGADDETFIYQRCACQLRDDQRLDTLAVFPDQHILEAFPHGRRLVVRRIRPVVWVIRF